MMTIETGNLRSLVRGPNSQRQATLMTLVIWFCAGAFGAATLLSYLTSIDGKLLPALFGALLAIAATVVKFR